MALSKSEVTWQVAVTRQRRKSKSVLNTSAYALTSDKLAPVQSRLLHTGDVQPSGLCRNCLDSQGPFVSRRIQARIL